MGKCYSNYIILKVVLASALIEIIGMLFLLK